MIAAAREGDDTNPSVSQRGRSSISFRGGVFSGTVGGYREEHQ